MNLSQELAETGDVWERLARLDPLWAILSESDKRGRKWALEEFLATGAREAAEMVARAEAAGERIGGKRALDFGCGVGRWSLALRKYFDTVVGVDVSETMVKMATEIHRADPGLSFRVNRAPDLSQFADDTFDFVNSHITLQHIPPLLARKYIAEFFRIVRPGGHVYFQLPSHLVGTGEAGQGDPSDDNAPITPDFCLAGIDLLAPPPALEANRPATVKVKVINLSPHRWPSLNLGNHWRDLEGKLLARDDGRVAVPRLQPGASAVVDLEVFAPAVPGEYLLELDMVQELVMWFSDAGRDVFSKKIAVTAPTGEVVVPAIAGFIEPEYAKGPTFQMNGILRDEVLHLASRNRMRIVQVHEDENVWINCEYIFKKRDGSPSAAGRMLHQLVSALRK